MIDARWWSSQVVPLRRPYLDQMEVRMDITYELCNPTKI